MKRSLLGFGLVATLTVPVLAQPPAAVTSPTPKIRLARAVDAKLVLEDIWSSEELVAETRTITENGVTKTVTVAVPVNVLRTTREEVALKEVKAFDLDGRQVTPGRLEHMLKERMAVAIGHGNGKLDPAFRKILRDDTLVLVLPPAQPVP